MFTLYITPLTAYNYELLTFYKAKVKFTLAHTIKAQRWSRGIALEPYLWLG
jgi:hypothetical protein